MISNLIKNIFGSRNSRILKEYTPIINQINSLEKTYQGFTQADFIKETENLKRLQKFPDFRDFFEWVITSSASADDVSF